MSETSHRHLVEPLVAHNINPDNLAMPPPPPVKPPTPIGSASTPFKPTSSEKKRPVPSKASRKKDAEKIKFARKFLPAWSVIQGMSDENGEPVMKDVDDLVGLKRNLSKLSQQSSSSINIEVARQTYEHYQLLLDREFKRREKKLLKEEKREHRLLKEAMKFTKVIYDQDWTILMRYMDTCMTYEDALNRQKQRFKDHMLSERIKLAITRQDLESRLELERTIADLRIKLLEEKQKKSKRRKQVKIT